MQQSNPSPIRHRWALLALALLSLAAAVPLLGAPARTATLFAFTLPNAETALFLGCCQLAAAVALVVAWREGAWGGAAVLGPGVFAATALALATTLSELPRLHLAGAGLPASAVSAGWLAAAWAAPLGWLYLVFTNDRAWSSDPPARRPLPGRVIYLAAVQAAVLLVVGGWLFVAPEARLLPWAPGDPGGRLAGGWLVAAGMTGVALLVERDEGRTRPAFAGCLVLGVSLLVAAALEIRPRLDPRAIAYAVFLVSLLPTGAIGLRHGIRDRRSRAAPFVR